MPNLSRIDVGKLRKPAGKMLFYPNGQKGVNLERELTARLNQCTVESQISRPVSKAETKKSRSKPRVGTASTASFRNESSLYSTKKPAPEVANIIASLRNIENKLDLATGIKT